MTRTEFAETVHRAVESRIREGVKAVIEQILEEEMTAHIGAARRARSPLRRDERNGHYQRGLITPVAKVEQPRLPRARQGEFLTEGFDRYQRMTGNAEEAVLEMYLQGVSTRKVAAIADASSGVRIGKGAVSRIAARLDDELKEWRARPLTLAYADLYTDAAYLKVKRNVLGGVPASEMAEVGADRKQIFKVSRSSSAQTMAAEFVERYQKKYVKAVGVFKRGIEDGLCYMRSPGSHHNFIRTANGLERRFREVKRRTRVVGVFLGEKSAVNLSTTVMLRATEEWALRRYMDMEPLKALNSNPQL